MTATDPKLPFDSVQEMIKKLLSPALLFASLLLSVLILHDAITGLLLSEAFIRESFQGAAIEDVFGFGFWPFLIIFGVIQLMLIGLSWAIDYKARWLLAASLAAAFSLLLWAVDFQRIEAITLSSGFP